MNAKNKLFVQEKFYVYLMKNDINSVEKVFTNNEEVLDLLKNRDRNNILTILRPATTQYAFLVFDNVVWVDVSEYKSIVHTNISF